jgi:hypothetical protein
VRLLEHTFTQHQLLTSLVVRELMAKSYRDLVDLIELMTLLLRILHLT